MSANAASILVKKLGKSATLTLNRPKALNALNSEMCNIVKQSLNLWNKNMNQTDVKVDTSLLPADAPEKVTSFLMNSSSEKAFCAGGDVRQLWDDCMDATKTDTLGLGHRDRISANFFVEEYEMNYMLGTSTIPQVSVWNGITMGGGVGISVLGDFRIATEKTLFAMPETAIGLFPDVGSSAWLPHLAPGVGEYIGLTGVRLGPGDLVFTGIATHYIPSSKLGELEQKIAESQADSTDESRKELRSILKTISESPPITPEEIEAAGSGRNHTNIIRNNIDTIR